MISFKYRQFQKAVILQCVRWYCAYSLSTRNLEEMMQERGIFVDHTIIHRWVVHYASKLEPAFRKNRKRVNSRWHLDETYIKVKGVWKTFYRAVDSEGNTLDFLLTAKRDKKAALRFLKKAIKNNGSPSRITIDKSGSNTAAIKAINDEQDEVIEIRRNKYKNNIVEQDHRRIKRIVRPMMGFKNFHCTQKTLAGIEFMAMLKKGQTTEQFASNLSPAEQFYALAA